MNEKKKYEIVFLLIKFPITDKGCLVILATRRANPTRPPGDLKVKQKKR